MSIPTPAPAQAAANKPRLVFNKPVKVASGTPRVQLRAEVLGRVTGRVKVQRRTNGSWRTVRRIAARPRMNVTVQLPELPARFRLEAGSGSSRVRSRVVKVSSVKLPTPASFADDPVTAARARILFDTNTLRAINSMPPLRPMAALDQVATAWSQRMANTGTMSHNPHYAKQYPANWRAAAENVAYGYQPSRVVGAWSRSAGHRANLLGRYTHLGIGYATDDNGVAYYTQDFARY